MLQRWLLSKSTVVRVNPFEAVSVPAEVMVPVPEVGNVVRKWRLN